MKLSSLKQTRQDCVTCDSADGGSKDYYPSLYLDEKSLDAMALDNQKPGTEMMMVSLVRVSSVRDNSDGDRSMEFEILEASVKPKEPEHDAANILFPNG